MSISIESKEDADQEAQRKAEKESRQAGRRTEEEGRRGPEEAEEEASGRRRTEAHPGGRAKEAKEKRRTKRSPVASRQPSRRSYGPYGVVHEQVLRFHGKYISDGAPTSMLTDYPAMMSEYIARQRRSWMTWISPRLDHADVLIYLGSRENRVDQRPALSADIPPGLRTEKNHH